MSLAAPKASKAFVNATFNKAYANEKNGPALGVSVNAFVRLSSP